MSRVYFHSKTGQAELLGAERAYIDVMINDLSMAVLPLSFLDKGHPIYSLIPTSKRDRVNFQDGYGKTYLNQQSIKYYVTGLSGSSNTLKFDGGEYDCWRLCLNTVASMESPVLSLLTRIHAQCEMHGYFGASETDYIADIIDGGRETNVMRPDMGWENVSKFLRETEGPVVMSYSVCDTFPSVPRSWLVEGDLDDSVYERFDELPSDEQWSISFAELEKEHKSLQITEENMLNQRYGHGKSLYDAMASPDWIR